MCTACLLETHVYGATTPQYSAKVHECPADSRKWSEITVTHQDSAKNLQKSPIKWSKVAYARCACARSGAVYCRGIAGALAVRFASV